MKVIGVLTLITASALFGCGPGVPTRDLSNKYSYDVTDANSSTIPKLSGADLNPPHGQPGHRCDIKVGQPLSSKPAAKPLLNIDPMTATPAIPAGRYAAPFVDPNLKAITNTAAAAAVTPADGLNPPHGKPGHRCDIQVGQPLNSKPAPSTASNSTVLPASASTVNTTPVAPGMNPRHGQPGHRCDIPVGQPLTSKPSLPIIPNNSKSPTAPAPAANAVPVAPGLNPRHGQPGHRCDILVGQPLNSKPGQTSSPASPVAPWKAPTQLKGDSSSS